MSRRRNSRHAGFSETTWRYLNDLPPLKNACPIELNILEDNALDCSTGYRLADAWEVHRDTILADWIRRRPGTRPWTWWKLESGLPDVYRPDPQRPHEIIEDTQKATSWLLGRTQDNKRRLTDAEREELRPAIMLNQRAWLKKRGLLLEGE